MLLTDIVKPISYVKSHAAEIVKNISKSHKPVVITQNGEAKAVLMNLADYESTQESLAMLKIAAQGANEVKEGKAKDIDEAFASIDAQINQLKKSLKK